MARLDGKRTVVIIAEDDPDDRLLIRDAIHEASERADIHFVNDGAEMLDYLHHRGRFNLSSSAPLPELILLDLNMPRKGGMEVLEEIKRDPVLRSIPVVVLTTSRSPEQVSRSYELGGNGYITKPNSYTELVQVMKTLDSYWFGTVELP